MVLEMPAAILNPVNAVLFSWHKLHPTSFFRCSPRGFSATCLQQIQGSVVEGLSQTATSGSPCFFVWDIKLCPQLTVHNTGISLLLSTSVWVLLSPPIERRETRPTAERPCPRTVWRKKVAESSTLNQAGAWTRDLLVGSQRSNQLRQPRTH